VEFIVVGGVAGVIHGSARLTFDVDVVYRRTQENIARLAAALGPHEPYLRGAPPGLPFRWDTETIRRGLNFTLSTKLGPLDLLGEVAGGGTYEQLILDADKTEIAGASCLVVNLEALIQLKKAAGRPKDLEAIAELERIRDGRF
jgi:hypothetical protein